MSVGAVTVERGYGPSPFLHLLPWGRRVSPGRDDEDKVGGP